MSTAPAPDLSPDFGPDFWSKIPHWPDYSVSRETVSGRLQVYLDLLRKWQAKMNLVSPDSLPAAPVRHFLDSVQILPLLYPTDKILVDIGSGAGFPGLALALCRDDLAVHLIESDAKKGEFMKTVSRETRAYSAALSAQGTTDRGAILSSNNPRFIPPVVHTARIEKAAPFHANVMTARALAPLKTLLDYAMPFVMVNPAIRLIFLKGEGVSRETQDAAKDYLFTMREWPSVTEHKGRILELFDIRRK